MHKLATGNPYQNIYVILHMFRMGKKKGVNMYLCAIEATAE